MMLRWIGLAVLVLALVVRWLLQSPYTIRTPGDLHSAYDYIIVGAGSAGCVLAARLSENTNVTVLLIEAGTHEPPWYARIPGMVGKMQLLPEVDWNYYTEPQEHAAFGHIEHKVKWPRGKMLGGCSLHNYMLHHRGDKRNYEYWESLGNTGWSYKNVLPYFKKMEKVLSPSLFNDEYHGFEGPVSIIHPGPVSKIGHIFMRAVRSENQLPVVEDYNHPDTQEGYSTCQYVIGRGLRASTDHTYLVPAMSRSNLHVISNSHVTKILFSPKNNQDNKPTAIGVTYVWNNHTYTVHSRKDIVVSGGTVDSPKLLLLSGLGPANELQKLNIDIIKDMPAVGKHMTDHVLQNIFIGVNESVGISIDSYGSLWNKLKYLLFGTGPYGIPPPEGIAHWDSGLRPNANETGFDLQFVQLPHAHVAYPTNMFHLTPNVLYAAFGQEPHTRGRSFEVSIGLQQPLSEGEIRLRTNNPMDHPIIDPRYFSNELDVKIMLSGLKRVLQLLNSPELQKYDAKLLEEPTPGCEHMPLLSDDYLLCMIKQRANTIWHPMSSCRMGKDPSIAVVDNLLRVHGIKNLRVVDASVFPSPISGNTNSPTIMLAEKAADIIKQANWP